MHVELDRRNKLDPNSKMCTFIGYGTSKYDYQFWDLESRKILRHKDVVFNKKKMYKDLLMERSTPERDLGVTPWSTREQQRSATDSEFVELNDVPVEKIQSTPKENVESRVEPLTLTLQTKVR